MLERQLEYERVRLEAESRKACLESQEKVGDSSLFQVQGYVPNTSTVCGVKCLHVVIYRRDCVPS